MKNWKQIGLWIIWTAFGASSTVFAGGFQVNLQSVAQAAMGHTGAGLAFDASVAYFNPGGLAFAPSSASVGVTPIFPRISYLAPSPDTYTASNLKTISTPFSLYGSYRLRLGSDHRLAAGLAVYTPFGSRVAYPDDWKGQFALREISLKTIFIQPTLGYNYRDKFGIGAGFIYATGDVLLRRAMPVQFSDGSYGEATLSAGGKGVGFNIGVMARPMEAFTLGLTYRSALKFEAQDGEANFNVPSALAEYFPTTSFSGAISLPATATIGGAYKINAQHTVAVDINYVFWSIYDSLNFDFAQNTDKLDDLKSAKNYQNAFILRAGWQGEMSDKIRLRGGITYDLTPVPDGYLTPETPDANKLAISGGLGLQLKSLRLDATFMWVEGAQRYDINAETNFGGTFKGRAFIPGIGVTYCFEKPGPIKGDGAIDL
jgi:long-chain fatty acid transport protein